jgi:hypothetical protein
MYAVVLALLEEMKWKWRSMNAFVWHKGA